MTLLPEYPPWLHEMEAQIARYPVPLVYGPDDFQSNDDLRNGTGVIVQTLTARFLVTAAHVIEKAWEAMKHGSVLIAGTLELRPSRDDVWLHPIHDLATILLSSHEVARLEADGRAVWRPALWPPRAPQQDDLVEFSGFPAAVRAINSPQDGTLNMVTAQAIVVRVEEGDFLCRAEPEDLRQHDVPTGAAEEVLDHLGGMSGGPAFRIELAPLIRYELCGLVYEAETIFSKPHVKFVRLDDVTQDGRLPRNRRLS